MIKFKEQEYLEHCLNRLAVEIGARPAGSRANRAAMDFIAGELGQAGYEVVLQEYPCPDWEATFCEFVVNKKTITAVANTFSPSCDIEAELVPVSSAGDLEDVDLTGKIAVLYGDLTSTGFMPKNFDRRYYADESKDRFFELLEQCQPGAIIAVNHYDGPRPVLLEDSEFFIPSVTVARQDGPFILQNAGARARLKIASSQRDSTGANVIGRRSGSGDKRIIICAHYDTKPGTPGALDNAAGIAALLSLARSMKNVAPGLALEFVAYGGEDSWFPGDALYIQEYPPENVVAAINIDGVGLKDAPTAIAFFACAGPLVGKIMEYAQNGGNFVQEQFYASDHGFFWPLGIPTLALTTSTVLDLLGTIVHTANDRPEILDLRIIQQVTELVSKVVLLLADYNEPGVQ